VVFGRSWTEIGLKFSSTRISALSGSNAGSGPLQWSYVIAQASGTAGATGPSAYVSTGNSPAVVATCVTLLTPQHRPGDGGTELCAAEQQR